MAFEQKVVPNGMSRHMVSAQQFIDPRPSAAFDVNNNPSASDDKTTQELSGSLSNTMEVMSVERSGHINKVPGKQTCTEDGLDQSFRSLGSTKSPKLDETKDEEQVPELVPFRKARVSVRARSEAPLVRKQFS